MNTEWHRDFFTGVVVRSWDGAVPQEQTDQECAFILERLNLAPNRRILDLHCGYGRHALELAAAGHRVTGVDSSTEFLELGRRKATERGLSVEWHCADSREPLPCEPFDAAICMGNSFGYLPRSGMRLLLANLGRSVRPGGQLLIDSGAVAESILPALEDRLWFRNADVLMLFENHYVCTDSRLDTTCTFIENGQQEVRQFSHWVYTLGEIVRMLGEAGFGLQEALGSIQGEPYRLRSRYAYLICRRC